MAVRIAQRRAEGLLILNRYQIQPVAYKLKNSNYELAIGKLEKNKTGYLANLNYTMLYTYGKSCKADHIDPSFYKMSPRISVPYESQMSQ